jgi:outer membrane protein TolC
MDTLVSQVSQELLNAQFSADNTLDIQLIQGGLGMRELNVKAKKAALLPSLAGFYNLQTQALRREFNFTDTSQPWFPIQLWGVQLNVPILSGGSKSKEIQMAQLEVRRMTDMLANARTGVELEYRRSRSDFEFSLSNVANTKASIQLAESILNKTNTKFKEGMSSSFDVAQSTNQFITAQSNYIQAIQKLLDARVRLAKSLNQL